MPCGSSSFCELEPPPLAGREDPGGGPCYCSSREVRQSSHVIFNPGFPHTLISQEGHVYFARVCGLRSAGRSADNRALPISELTEGPGAAELPAALGGESRDRRGRNLSYQEIRYSCVTRR